jgi:hypothetical protein
MDWEEIALRNSRDSAPQRVVVVAGASEGAMRQIPSVSAETSASGPARLVWDPR